MRGNAFCLGATNCKSVSFFVPEMRDKLASAILPNLEPPTNCKAWKCKLVA